MYKLPLLGSLALGLCFATPLPAQQVSADIHVVLGDHDRYPDHRVYRRVPARRVVVVERAAPRVIVVERVHHRHKPRHAHRHWRKHGYRPVAVYLDARHHVFLDRYDDRKPGLREVVVWERGGRYYSDWGWNEGNRHDHRARYDHDGHDD